MERWGRMWVRRWLKRGTFPAVADLRERILAEVVKLSV
jgi:hypothetical protein